LFMFHAFLGHHRDGKSVSSAPDFDTKACFACRL
jgi:hypothetical protein